MKCDICNIESTSGFTVRVTDYDKRYSRITKKWRTVRRFRKIFVCRKCESVLFGLIRNYRKETIH